MQKGKFLQFNCLSCQDPLCFSVLDVQQHKQPLCCKKCQKKYAFNDPVLLGQLEKFEALCRQIRLAEEILSDAVIGVDVGPHQVEIPYKILLTRFNTLLKLKIGEVTIPIKFRIEPLQEA